LEIITLQAWQLFHLFLINNSSAQINLLKIQSPFPAGSIFFTKDRYEAVDMIKMDNPHAIRFVVRKPWTSYMKNIFVTFNWSVWVASAVVLAVFATAVNILNWETRNKQVSSCRLPDFFSLFYRVVESQTEQVRSERCNFNRIGSRLSTRLCFKGE
jgi:hypothetical protein